MAVNYLFDATAYYSTLLLIPVFLAFDLTLQNFESQYF